MSAEQQANYAVGLNTLRDLAGEGTPGASIGEDLFGVVGVLHESHALVHGLTNVARTPDDRAALAATVFGSKISDDALKIVVALSREHWTRSEGLPASLEDLGVDACLLAAAENTRSSTVPQELVDAYTLVLNNRDLRIQLSDLGEGNPEDRAALAGKIFSGHLDPITVRLVSRAARSAAYGRLAQTLRGYADRAAGLEGKTLAIATSARPLTSEQVERLHALAERRWDRPIVLTTTVDPALIGGFRLDVGEESMDTSIRQDINAAKLAMTR